MTDWNKIWNERDKKVKTMLADRNIPYPPCGFYISDGWYPHVVAALDKMIAAGWNRELAQVKEKFGGLRLYIGEATLEVRDIVRETEALCDTLCEHCGKPHGRSVPLSGQALCKPCAALDLERAKAELAETYAKRGK